MDLDALPLAKDAMRLPIFGLILCLSCAILRPPISSQRASPFTGCWKGIEDSPALAKPFVLDSRNRSASPKGQDSYMVWSERGDTLLITNVSGRWDPDVNHFEWYATATIRARFTSSDTLKGTVEVETHESEYRKDPATLVRCK
ncbi:MAG: hypothetical protein JWL80_47 [Parcubacteria group bacterium]|nr:hypothetical protein [Parcubacteria group bacterium]